ncbi:lamin tail domain-containing protein [Actinocorallia sp. A-T 12471]|uniref:lamin tail domain-containing protein n=1 Tax=Actinocorallia sp. A-T 12471 TaxID=3089813 RepID=UPI0029CF8C77|nr:lamin tail domain-containing protein [Actinocorallia sp. A-T 12471]MDX6739734.1 lamin tail domain-containing protein [Actinocorallia sp. A-T 12471]
MRTPLIGALAVALPLSALLAAPAQAAPNVQITYVQYDAKGKDTKKNVNGEYVVVTNKSRKKVNLAGWTIGQTARLGDSKYIFYFPARNVWVQPGKSLTMRMGEGKKTKKFVYQGLRKHTWPNKKGAAYLFNPSNTRVDGCTWNSKKGFKKC